MAAVTVLAASVLLAAAAEGPGRGWKGEVWNVDPYSDDYVWPKAYSHCIPCKEKRVGTCFLSSCYEWRGPTECIITRCVCAEGFCAAENPLPGQEKCVPQTCIAGPRPLPFEPGILVRGFAWLGGSQRFPIPLDVQRDETRDFLKSVVLRSAWLVAVGVLATAATFCTFCCCKPPPRVKPRDRASKGTANQKLDASPAMLLLSNDDAGRKVLERPRILSLVGVALLTFGLSAAGVVFHSVDLNRWMGRVTVILARVRDNAMALKSLGALVYGTCAQLDSSLQALEAECSHEPLIRALAGQATSSIKQYVLMVEQLHLTLDKFPSLVDQLAAEILRKENLVFWIPLMPVLVVATACAFMLGEALLIACRGSSRWAIRLDRVLGVSMVPQAVLIMLAAIFGALGLAAAFVSSAFCSQVDENVIALVLDASDGNLTDIVNMTDFYIRGTGVTNPVMGYAKTALNQIREIADVHGQFIGVINAYELTCPPLADVKIEEIALQAQRVLGRCVQLLEPGNIYPYYEHLVREAFCTDAVVSLGCFPAVILGLGTVCFPLCVVITHRFLVHYAHWRQAQERAIVAKCEEAGGPSEEDGDEDSTESGSDAASSTTSP